MNIVAIHIVTYNSAQTIKQCLQSLEQQTFTDFDVLIIDNNSSDDTINIVRSLGYNILSNPQNIGYAGAHNQAIALTKSTYVLTLNPDVYLHKNFLSQMIRHMNQLPEVGSASGCLFRVNCHSEESDTIDSAGLWIENNRRQRLRYENERFTSRHKVSSYIFGPDGAAAMYRRHMLEDIKVYGYIFDEDFFIHKEDVDVCWRAQLRGWKAVYIPSAQAKHIRTFRPGKRQPISSELKLYAVRNRYLLILKNDILSHYLSDLHSSLLYDIMIIGFLVLREWSSLKYILYIVMNFQKIMKKRRYIQQTRVVSTEYIRSAFKLEQPLINYRSRNIIQN